MDVWTCIEQRQDDEIKYCCAFFSNSDNLGMLAGALERCQKYVMPNSKVQKRKKTFRISDKDRKLVRDVSPSQGLLQSAISNSKVKIGRGWNWLGQLKIIAPSLGP